MQHCQLENSETAHTYPKIHISFALPRREFYSLTNLLTNNKKNKTSRMFQAMKANNNNRRKTKLKNAYMLILEYIYKIYKDT